ncbi:polysaccharide deacetylase family protein [Fodinibius sediminis]|uniref:NodB homology domain-containing protein n=1 Tax=Fodinibius sediminis TaxID=1214077 RepID=A0A521EUL5_9BACT|nr:polysaccharide deacetylase family protein [Fodinibius sediminis]SMO87584.1 hypothetical protein SAMN06265218_11915 [Fodinibius sediminis]
MEIVLTLDYELYFGEQTGTVSESIIEATNKLLAVLDCFGVKAVFFVDVGFVKRLEYFKEDHSKLEEDYMMVKSQIESLSQEGHDIQLHIHPHWEDSMYREGKWHINAQRYRLDDWPQKKVNEIVTGYANYLKKFAIKNEVFAYRAGGWCIQPFDKIGKALRKNNIWLDSTVFKGGYNETKTHYFDFRNAPQESTWNFETDPLAIDSEGSFLEIPISSYKVSPAFFWKLAFTKITKKRKHNTLGDGVPLAASKTWIIKKLLFPSYSVASMDGYKASLLQRIFRNKQRDNSDGFFVVIGHPKALSEYSLAELRKFIEQASSVHKFRTFSNLLEEGKITAAQ